MSSSQPTQTPANTSPSNSTSISTSSRPPILLLKTKSTPHDGYEEFFSAHGYGPAFVPVLEHRFRDDNLQRVKEDVFYYSDAEDEAKAATTTLSSSPRRKKYGGLIFTSQRAVEGLARLVEREVDKSIATKASRSLIIYTVGPATARSLKPLRDTYLPHAEIYGADAGNGENLARMILEHYNARYQRDVDDDVTVGGGGGGEKEKEKLPLLFLVGDQRRDIIPKMLMRDPHLAERERIIVDEVVVYETGVMESFERDFELAVQQGREWLRLRRGLHFPRQTQSSSDADVDADVEVEVEGEMIWVVVFSPTGCDAMLRVLGRLPSPPSSSSMDAAPDHGSESISEKEQEKKKDEEKDTTTIRIATIGPTTRDHLRSKYGVEPDVCAEVPSPEGVGRGIEEYLQKWRK